MKTVRALLLLLLLAITCAAQRIPNFDRAISLEDKAATSANASLGDLNGDRFPDIVLAKGRHWPLVDQVLLNDGKGRFNRRHTLSERADRTYTAAVADLDGDGDLDVIVGNDAPDEKVIYFNDGKANFTFAGTFGDKQWPTRNITVVDLNRDRRPDIVVANRTDEAPGANYVCLNDGHGKFPSCRPLSTESATTIAAGDLNGDDVPDLVVPHRDGGQSYIYINDGKGGFAERHPFGPAKTETRSVALGDLDGDGRLDIIIGDQARGGAAVYFNQGGQKFSEPLSVSDVNESVYSIAVADMNGDGYRDVVLGNMEAPGAVLLNGGTGRKFSRVSFGDKQGAVYGLALGDVNGDGSIDIVAARSDAVNMLYLNSLSLQAAGAKRDELSRVTFFSALRHNPDSSRTSLNFDTGELGVDPDKTAQHYDVSYGTVKIDANADWFEVRDARSRIVDLGVKRWDEFKETPQFPQPKSPIAPSLEQRKVIDVSAGSKDVSPLRQIVPARIGHMYLMRVAKGTRAKYVMFRVEALTAEQSCQISWKRVVPPNVIDEN